MRENKSAERTLFFSLWIIILLALAFWKFWPSTPATQVWEPLAIEISGQLLPWFPSGQVKDREGSHFAVVLQLSPEYRKSLRGQRRTVHLAYDLSGDNGKSAQGIAPCYISPLKADVTVKIPNPQRILAKKIRLTLAQ